MGMVVRTNTMALNAYRQLGMNNSAVAKSLEKLSSGFRINRAGDDAAGLAISEKMKAQIKGLETASSNAQDGISLIQTAEGNLSEVHDMLNRMVELAAKSANGTYTVTERQALQDEVNSLLSEIDRISQSANFNGTNLLDGSLSDKGKSVGGADRMLQTIFTTGNPVDQVGKQTILDGGTATPATKTKFEIDFSDLKISGGAAAGNPTITAGTAATGFTATAGATANAGDAIKVKTEANTGSLATAATGSVAITWGATPTWANGDKVVISSTGGDTNLNLTATYDGTDWAVTGTTPTGYTAAFDGTNLTLTADDTSAKAAEPDYGTVTVTPTNAGNGTLAGTGVASFTNGKDAVAAGGTKVTVTVGTATQSKIVADADWDAGTSITVGGVTVAVDKTAGKTQAETTIGTVKAGDAAVGPSFDIKIGDLNLTGVQLAAGTTAYEEVDIAQAILNKMANVADGAADATEAEVTINGVNWTVKNGADATKGGLVFEMKDIPTDAAKTRGDFAWDVSAGTGTKIEGNHNAGTIVTQKGAVESAAARANTVFNITAADIKDGTTIRIDDVTVVLAVGKDSKTEKGSNDALIDLKDMEEGSVDLHNALSRISDGFKGYTTDFEVGVSDKQGNADVQEGLAVYKKAGITTQYDTKEKLAAIFELAAKGSPLTLQIGDTADPFNKMNVSINDMSTNGLGLKGLSIMTETDASNAIDTIKKAINTVSSTRASMGALQNRLEHTINNLDVAAENLSAANSRIRDTDMAKEMMNYTKMNVLVQSAQAMLAQANQQPQSVLQLLQ